MALVKVGVRRRSIVLFEKKLDELIERLAQKVAALEGEQAEAARKRAAAEAKLETAREIKALMMKTAFPPVPDDEVDEDPNTLAFEKTS